MKILITGKKGQLGSELQNLQTNYPEHLMIFADRTEMDLSDPAQIIKVLNHYHPEVIVNAAAYTAVDRAESESELADLVNHKAVKVIGEWAYQNNAKVIHISTDYVFDGNSTIPLKETDEVNPVNTYGKTKYSGEQALIHSKSKNIIIRTSWVYSSYGANFVKTMLRLMKERDEISVVADQIGSPTYARDLAQVILEMIQKKPFVEGIYHYSNEGFCSWYEFAKKIQEIRNADCVITPINTSDYPTPAKRPQYSLLDKSKIKRTFGIQIPDWTESLKEMLDRL